jgi:hypothetical protein
MLPRAISRSMWNADRAFKMASLFIVVRQSIYDIRPLAYRYA